VIERFATTARRVHRDLKRLFDFGLPDEVVET
jgi:hypothetical protein